MTATKLAITLKICEAMKFLAAGSSFRVEPNEALWREGRTGEHPAAPKLTLFQHLFSTDMPFF